jgi:hypothetical protein
VISGMLPMGARVMGPAGDGKLWLDACILGTHIPQQFWPHEITELTGPECARLGLCPDCLGYGTVQESGNLLGVGVDQVPEPCGTCEGNGRPFTRAHVRRSSGAIEVWQEILPHDYAPPVEGAAECCMACGSDEDNENHHTLAAT